MSLEDFEPDFDPMDCVLLVCFKEAEQPQELRDFFNRAGAFEFGVGAWLIPIATDTDTFLEKLNAHFPSLNQGVAVMSLSRFGRPPSVQDWPALSDWWKSAREPGQ